MRLIAALLFALAALPAAAQPAPTTRTISAAEDLVVNVTVNGQSLRLRVDPGIGLVLNRQAAERIGLRASMLAGQIRIGPVRVPGHSKVARLRIDTWEGRRRFFWFDRDVVEGADGTIGVADLPQDQIVLALRAPQPGERRYEMAVESEGLLGLTHRFQIGERRADVRFTLLTPQSQASAAVGGLLGDLYGGSWNGEAGESLVGFGVMRPLRPMRLARPLLLGDYPVGAIGVRTTDYRGNHALPADQEAEADPSEIIVTAQRDGGRALYRMMIGNDRLARCSSLTYSRPAQRVTLSCLPE